MSSRIILFGAGSAGQWALKTLRERGETVLAFTDNDPRKWDTVIDGLQVVGPRAAQQLYPDAEWVAATIRHPYGREIRQQLHEMGVKTKPLWECLPVQHGVPSNRALQSMLDLAVDSQTYQEIHDQYNFRLNPDYEEQDEPSDIRDIYFPDFITHMEDEHFCDLGAASGDTIDEFTKRWQNWSFVTAVEPDRENYKRLRTAHGDHPWISLHWNAVSDFYGQVSFQANGDFSSHLGGDGGKVYVHKLDDMRLRLPPTYIKADIEGSELEMLWGARRILAEHKPVLAICAYHKSEDLWQIPLLIHALQPEYSLHLRRYAEGSWELVWYAVPPERIKRSEPTLGEIAISDFDCPGIHESPAKVRP